MKDFIPLFHFPSEYTDDKKQILFLNRNTIHTFSYVKLKGRECLQICLDMNRVQGSALPRNFVLCKEDNPVAFNELFRTIPDRLPDIKNVLQ
jgi:hypothetical protein